MAKSKTFCLAPWTHGFVNTDLTMRPCCNITVSSGTLKDRRTWWNSPYMQNLRQSLFDGIRHPDCNKCWADEDAKKESLRLNYNNLFRKYTRFSDILESKSKKFILDYQPITWDLKLGNLCNLKCVMCWPHLSNKIEQEISINQKIIAEIFPDKLDKIYKSLPDWTDEAILDWTDHPDAVEFLDDIKSSVRWLKLQGGEPLAVKSVRDLINSLNPKQSTLAITTNGTILDAKLIENLKLLDRAEISISVEAIGPENNIIRYGSDWETVSANILKLKELNNVDIQLNHVLQITSVFYLKDVIKFCEEHQLHLAIGSLSYPEYLSLNACPEPYLNDLVDSISELDIKHPKNQYIKQYVRNKVQSTKFNQTAWNDFKKYVKLLDTIRPNKYSSVLKFKELL